MSSEHETFQNAYRAWKAATDLYNTEIESLWAGDKDAYERLQPIISDLSKKHGEFMEASKPFVYPRK